MAPFFYVSRTHNRSPHIHYMWCVKNLYISTNSVSRACFPFKSILPSNLLTLHEGRATSGFRYTPCSRPPDLSSFLRPRDSLVTGSNQAFKGIFMRMLSPGILLSIVLLTSACSHEDAPSNISTAQETESTPNPVIITMGGFNSCESSEGTSTPRGNHRWDQGARLSEKFAQESELWLRSCFDKWGNIHYISSLNRRRILTVTIDTLDEYLATISTLSERGRNPVFILGHSHGGWLALTTIHQLPSWVSVKLISTVDPISPKHCTPSNYIAAIAAPIFSGTVLEGCRQAPTDLNDSIRADILARIPDGSWRHYYQRNFLPLSSSAFGGSSLPHFTQDLSPFLSNFPSGARPSFNAHSGIAELSLVWYSFEVSLERALTGN